MHQNQRYGAACLLVDITLTFVSPALSQQYFCEDGGDECGVHGRDAQGNFFTILQDATGAFSGETTGLAFSPNGKFMYVSFQSPGIIFEIKRTDGLPFYGATLDIKYHNSGDTTNAFRDRLLYEDNAKTCDTNAEMCHL